MFLTTLLAICGVALGGSLSVSPKCYDHIHWAVDYGLKSKEAPNWFANIDTIAGVDYRKATYNDMQRYFKCTNKHIVDCTGLSFPHSCSSPPCDNCDAKNPPAPTPQDWSCSFYNYGCQACIWNNPSEERGSGCMWIPDEDPPCVSRDSEAAAFAREHGDYVDVNSHTECDGTGEPTWRPTEEGQYMTHMCRDNGYCSDCLHQFGCVWIEDPIGSFKESRCFPAEANAAKNHPKAIYDRPDCPGFDEKMAENPPPPTPQLHEQTGDWSCSFYNYGCHACIWNYANEERGSGCMWIPFNEPPCVSRDSEEAEWAREWSDYVDINSESECEYTHEPTWRPTEEGGYSMGSMCDDRYTCHACFSRDGCVWIDDPFGYAGGCVPPESNAAQHHPKAIFDRSDCTGYDEKMAAAQDELVAEVA